MKTIIANKDLQYLLMLINNSKSYFDKNDKWERDVYKIGRIKFVQSNKHKRGKNIPPVATMIFENKAKNIFQIKDKQEREKQTKKLLRWVQEFTEENYNKWEDIK